MLWRGEPKNPDPMRDARFCVHAYRRMGVSSASDRLRLGAMKRFAR
jgi:hypothetical protein